MTHKVKQILWSNNENIIDQYLIIISQVCSILQYKG